MSEFTLTHRADLRRIGQVARRIEHRAVIVTKATARITWAVLKSLTMLAFVLGMIAGGGSLMWNQGGRLTDNDATLRQKMAGDRVPRGTRDADPFGTRVRSVDDERATALMVYNFGVLILLAGGAGVMAWCWETRDALSRLRSTGKA
jgi:hypothetical protein